MPFSLAESNIVTANASATAQGDGSVRVVLTLTIKEGWFLRGIAEDEHISIFQLDVRGDDVAGILKIAYPRAYHIDLLGDPEIIYWQGSVAFNIDVKLKSASALSPMRAVLTYQICTIGRCLPLQHAAVDIVPVG